MELKFRAWDKVVGIYLYSEDCPSMWQFFKKLEERGMRHYEAKLHIGLRDNNSKDIYDGDTVIASYHWTEPHVFEFPDDWYDIQEYALHDELTIVATSR